MKAYVDQSRCISCALCVDTCPAIFHFNEDAKAEAVNEKIPSDTIDLAERARDGCPVSVISIE